MKEATERKLADNLDAMEHTLAGLERGIGKVAELSLLQGNDDCYMYARWGHDLRRVIDLVMQSRQLMIDEKEG